MTALYREYLEESDFGSYEDFLRNFRIKTPENFNFALDVVDRIAAEEPDKTALVWTEPQGDTRVFSFADIRRESIRTAAMLQRLGIGRGGEKQAQGDQQSKYLFHGNTLLKTCVFFPFRGHRQYTTAIPGCQWGI